VLNDVRETRVRSLHLCRRAVHTDGCAGYMWEWSDSLLLWRTWGLTLGMLCCVSLHLCVCVSLACVSFILSGTSGLARALFMHPLTCTAESQLSCEIPPLERVCPRVVQPWKSSGKWPPAGLKQWVC
jgi:hypothetical protein